MKDLYRRLKIDPSATDEEIAAAIEALPEMKASAEILGDAERKDLYDRTHSTLKLIAGLRFRLDLDKSDAAFIRQYGDFAIMPKPKLGSGAAETPVTQAPAAKGKRRRRNRSGWLFPAVILLIVAVAIVLMITLF